MHLTNCTIVTFLQNNKKKQESRMKIPLKKKKKGFHFRRQNKARNRSPLGVHITLRTLWRKWCLTATEKTICMSVKKADISSRICHIYTHVLEVWCLQLLNKHLKMVSNYTAVNKKEKESWKQCILSNIWDTWYKGRKKRETDWGNTSLPLSSARQKKLTNDQRK